MAVTEESKQAEEPTDSVDVLYEYAKTRVARQDAHASTLDGKANFNLGTATLLTAGAVAFQEKVTGAWPWVVPGLTALAIVVYIGVIWCSFQAYRPRDYKVLGNVQYAVEAYLNAPEKSTKITLTETIATNTEHNQTVLEQKVKWTQWAVGGVFVEAIVLGALALVQLTN